MNFHDFFHEFFQFSMNLGWAATFQIFKRILVFGDSFSRNSVQRTQIVVSTKMHAINAIQLLVTNTVLHAVTSAVDLNRS